MSPLRAFDYSTIIRKIVSPTLVSKNNVWTQFEVKRTEGAVLLPPEHWEVQQTPCSSAVLWHRREPATAQLSDGHISLECGFLAWLCLVCFAFLRFLILPSFFPCFNRTTLFRLNVEKLIRVGRKLDEKHS